MTFAEGDPLGLTVPDASILDLHRWGLVCYTMKADVFGNVFEKRMTDAGHDFRRKEGVGYD